MRVGLRYSLETDFVQFQVHTERAKSTDIRWNISLPTAPGRAAIGKDVMRHKDALQAGQRFQPRGREPWTAGTRPEAGLCMLRLLYTVKALKHPRPGR